MNMAMVRVSTELAAPGPMAAILQITMAMANDLRIPSRSVSRPAIRKPMAYAAWKAAVIHLYSMVVKPRVRSR